MKYTLVIFHFSLFSLIACNQPTTTTTPPKTSTETVTQTNTASQDDTKQMLGNLADKKGDATTSVPEDLNNAKNSEDDLQTVTNADGTTTTHKKRHRHHHKKMYDRSPTGVLPGEGPSSTDEAQSDNQQVATPTGTVKQIPAKVYTVLSYVLKNHQAPAGYVGGRVFTNVEKVLPVSDAKGRRINYQEWDVNPHLNGVNRGTERLCTGDDKRYWYTNDHYVTFTQVIPK